MFTYEMTAVGIDHEHVGAPCEDHVTTFQWNGVQAEACADGVEGREAERLSTTLAQFMAMYFRSLRSMEDDQLRSEILRVIRSVQAELSSGDEMGCTVVAAAMDRRSHEYFGVSLGDGILLGRDHFSGNVYTALPPEKREDGSVCTTADPDGEILAHVRLVRGRAKDALMVSSNGLENTLWDATGSFLSPTVSKLMDWVVEDPEGVRTDFTELVYDLSLQDDAGVAVMVDRRVRLGAWEGRDPGLLCQRRRDARRYLDYLRWRDAGYSRKNAAQKAGWGWRSTCANIRYMRSIGLD